MSGAISAATHREYVGLNSLVQDVQRDLSQPPSPPHVRMWKVAYTEPLYSTDQNVPSGVHLRSRNGPRGNILNNLGMCRFFTPHARSPSTSKRCCCMQIRPPHLHQFHENPNVALGKRNTCRWWRGRHATGPRCILHSGVCHGMMVSRHSSD